MSEDLHIDIRARYKIIKRYLAKTGKMPPLVLGSRTISWELEQEALKAHAETMDARATATDDAKGPWPKLDPVPPMIMEPGVGDKRIAVLCPGPSLTETWPKGFEDVTYCLVLAVNNAGEHAPCDWWVCNDNGPLRKYVVRPRVGICSNANNVDTLNGDRSFELGARDLDLDGLTFLASNKLSHQDAPRKAGWSTVSAIVLAARLGANEIDLYGDDKSGTAYFDGGENKGSKDCRWSREKKNQGELVRALKRVGVTVRNIKPKALEADPQLDKTQPGD